MEKFRGKVKWFDKVKGFGFIVNELGEDVLFHCDSVRSDDYKALAEGQSVEYIQTRGVTGWQAAEVARVR